MTLPADSIDIYIDLETQPATHPHRDMRGYPSAPPPYELWAGGDPPHVRTPGEVRAGNRRADKRDAYIAEQIARDEAALRDWQATRRERYDALWLEHDATLAALRSETALNAYYGGTIACIGLAVDMRGVQVLHALNDPALEPAEELAYRAEEQDREQHWALYKAGEFRLLKRLAQAVQWASVAGLPKRADGAQQTRSTRIVAWNGFGFDFRFVALACVRNVAITEHTERWATPSDRRHGYDSDLLYLMARCWHGQPWRADGLYDPRVTWSFGGAQRIGKQLGVAEYLGWRPPQWAVDFDHSQIPGMLERPGARYTGGDVPLDMPQPTNLHAVAAVCELDVEALRYIARTLDDLGVVS